MQIIKFQNQDKYTVNKTLTHSQLKGGGAKCTSQTLKMPKGFRYLVMCFGYSIKKKSCIFSNLHYDSHTQDRLQKNQCSSYIIATHPTSQDHYDLLLLVSFHDSTLLIGTVTFLIVVLVLTNIKVCFNYEIPNKYFRAFLLLDDDSENHIH